MALNQVEKCAGRMFRSAAEEVLAAALMDFPDSAPCSAQAEYFRHGCNRGGRTRSVHLEDITLTSPELWVTWADGGGLRVISRAEAETRVAGGEAVEFETVLAGKFSFTWKKGSCPSCHLTAISREGVFRDARPLGSSRQDDLAVFSQGMLVRDTAGLRREHSVE